MATLEEELKLAKQAKVVIERKSRTETVEVLRKANQMAAAQMTTFSSEGPLNDARHKLGLALPLVIRALEEGQSSQDKIDKAKKCNRRLDEALKVEVSNRRRQLSFSGPSIAEGQGQQVHLIGQRIR